MAPNYHGAARASICPNWHRKDDGGVYVAPRLNICIVRVTTQGAKQRYPANLLVPLAELQSQYTTDGVPWYEPKVMTRSGDTSATDKRRMQRHPPEILVTTPESLNPLLSSVSGRGILQGIRMVILDEIHAVLDSKRGTHLSTAVESVAHLTG